MMRLRESIASISRETLNWLDAPHPAMGDGAYVVKLLLLAYGLLAAAALLLRIVPEIARAVGRALDALGGVRERLFVSEEAAADLEDESKRLEEAVADAQARVKETCASCAGETGDSLNKQYNDLMGKLSKQCASTAARCEEAFAGDHASILAWLDAEEDLLRRVIVDESVRLRIAARRAPAEKAFLACVERKLRPLLRKSQIEYRLRQNREELAPREGDTPFVRFMKAQRRADLRLWAVLGRKDAEIRLRRVPFREILTKRAGKDLLEALGDGAEDLKNFPAKASSALQDAARILRFNLESAAAELEEPSDEDADGRAVAVKLLREGLERTASRLTKLLGEAEETEARFLRMAQESAERCAARIQSDANVADTFGERASRIGEAVFETWTELLLRAKNALASTAALKNALNAPLTSLWESAGLALGLTKLEARSTQAQLEEATIEFARKEVPPLYRRLFRFEPLTDEDFLVGRDTHLEAFHRCKERVGQGLSGAVAVVGSIGSGKTSILNCAIRRNFKDGALVRSRIETPLTTVPELTRFLSKILAIEAGSLEALAAKIAARETAPVIILEGGNMLFERRVGGFEAMRAFLGLLSATEGKAVWAISFSQTGWDFLDRLLGLSKRFDEVVLLKDLTRKQMESALLLRHEVSGYDLQFSDGPHLNADARWRLRGVEDPRRRQEILRLEFFDELHQAAGSNFHAALFYWLRAAKVADQRRVVASPLQPITAAYLGDLGDDELFTALFILQHDALTAPQHARLLRTNAIDSGLTLDYLTRRRILLKNDENGPAVYTANPILAEPVRRILKVRNLVYG